MKEALILVALLLAGCGDTEGDANYTEVVSIDSGGGDVTINDVVVSDDGTYVYNADGTVTYTTGHDNMVEYAYTGDSNRDGVEDVEVGVYSADYTPEECAAAGFFYCTVSNMCLDQEASGGTCTSR